MYGGFGLDIARTKEIVELATGAARDIVSIVRGEPVPTWVQQTGEKIAEKTLNWTPIIIGGVALYFMTRRRRRQ